MVSIPPTTMMMKCQYAAMVCGRGAVGSGSVRLHARNVRTRQMRTDDLLRGRFG